VLYLVTSLASSLPGFWCFGKCLYRDFKDFGVLENFHLCNVVIFSHLGVWRCSFALTVSLSVTQLENFGWMVEKFTVPNDVRHCNFSTWWQDHIDLLGTYYVLLLDSLLLNSLCLHLYLEYPISNRTHSCNK